MPDSPESINICIHPTGQTPSKAELTLIKDCTSLLEKLPAWPNLRPTSLNLKGGNNIKQFGLSWPQNISLCLICAATRWVTKFIKASATKSWSTNGCSNEVTKLCPILSSGWRLGLLSSMRIKFCWCRRKAYKCCEIGSKEGKVRVTWREGWSRRADRSSRLERVILINWSKGSLQTYHNDPRTYAGPTVWVRGHILRVFDGIGWRRPWLFQTLRARD